MTQQLATIADLTTFGLLAPNALQGFSDDQKNAALLMASETFFAYTAEKFTAPLQSWGNDVRAKVVSVAVYALLSSRGFNAAMSGVDFAVVKNRDDAIAWMKDIGRGLARPPGIVDATPTVEEDAADGSDGDDIAGRYSGLSVEEIL